MIDFRKAPLKRNVTVILSVCFVILFLDQCSKSWADNNLATPAHPLPVQTNKEMSVRDALVHGLGISSEEADQLIADRYVVLLRGDPIKDPETKAYTEDNLVRGMLLYVFHRGLDRSPRVVSTIQTAVENEWLSPSLRAGGRPVLVDNITSKTLAEVVALDQDQLSEETIISTFENGQVFSAQRLFAVDSGKNMMPGQIALVRDRNVGVMSGFLRFRYAENPGAAWSFLASASPQIRFWFFTVVACIAVVVLLILSLNQPLNKKLPLCAYSMILGGAIGNLIDRIQSNFVIDFIDMYVGDSHWPTYNIADMGISVGVCLLLLDMFRAWRLERALARAS